MSWQPTLFTLPSRPLLFEPHSRCCQVVTAMFNLVILFLVSLLACIYGIRNRRQLSVPPGPRGIPS
ncbi:uncharacterized protein B0H18DRAFT_384056 [Fomitopsis serialis]|uniref:uncharacterized protein n=1 Tax=Fomitopsis serialis TaxID=139415 RepID=UPI002008E443|nr:uncharacterized protein B0H18DRAFT_384056 [Neoantrodia serialis]KAH9925319.1 hypothetical protein B0H18DRAFT_384056 [Neoantrodia serialis]